MIHEMEPPVRLKGAVARTIRERSGSGPVGPVSTLWSNPRSGRKPQVFA
ncbi:MAG: hypothetical protein ACJAZN_003243 [Planctomycetota bacterium]|jgi:hypothetical protein